MFGNLKKRVLKRKLQRVKEGIIELEAQIQFHSDMIEYEELSDAQKGQYNNAIAADRAQIDTNNKYLKYVEPLVWKK